MKIIILANRDIASNLALNFLLPRISAHDIYVYLSSSVGGHNKRPRDLGNLRFFEQQLFNDLLFPLLAKSGLSVDRQPLSFGGLGKLIGRQILPENAINSPDAIHRIRTIDPDLIVSIRYGGILREELISIPKFGVINLHSGKLPQYRGVMASFWAMLNGDSDLGTTLHFIVDSTIDTGAVISRTAAPIASDKSYLWNVLSLYPAGCGLIIQTINAFEAGEEVVTEPPSEGGQYFSFPTDRELKLFKSRGYQLYDTDEVLEIAKSYL